MSHDIETVLVNLIGHKNQDETFLINKRDFDESKHKIPGEKSENEFLKRKADEIIADLPALTDDELAAYRAEESEGKKRAGVIGAIDKEIESRKV